MRGPESVMYASRRHNMLAQGVVEEGVEPIEHTALRPWFVDLCSLHDPVDGLVHLHDLKLELDQGLPTLGHRGVKTVSEVIRNILIAADQPSKTLTWKQFLEVFGAPCPDTHQAWTRKPGKRSSWQSVDTVAQPPLSAPSSRTATPPVDPRPIDLGPRARGRKVLGYDRPGLDVANSALAEGQLRTLQRLSQPREPRPRRASEGAVQARRRSEGGRTVLPAVVSARRASFPQRSTGPHV
mmetsp:Transcript_93380/g.250072  ORF Transcript_93380/g.250072 Transcript_93380/m.250072 type:complete len:239 (-) Transcript_93380:479-1195(-)